MTTILIRLMIIPILLLTSLSSCASQPDHSATLKSIEQIELLLKQAERDGLQETQTLSVAALDSLYGSYVENWPDSTHAPRFLFNQANIKAEYLKDYESCITLLDTLSVRYGESEFAERAGFLKGYTLANQMQDTTRARVAYEDFLKRYPNSDLVPSVQFEIMMMGKSLEDFEKIINRQEE